MQSQTAFFLLYRLIKFRDDAQLGRETFQPPTTGGQDPKRTVQGRRVAPADFVTWDTGNSTGFAADTSKV